MNSYPIQKILNHNCILIKKENKSCLLIGKGIGFQRKIGNLFLIDSMIEEEFYLVEPDQYQKLSENPNKIVVKTAEIVEIIVRNIDENVDEKSLVSLSNHIAAMLVRIENSQEFSNPFHNETISLYEESYRLAYIISEEISEKIDVILPESEIDFLTLYIHSIRNNYQNKKVKLTNSIISQVVDLLEWKYKLRIDKKSIVYSRFIIHLKFIIQRVLIGDKVEEIEIINDLLNYYSQYISIGKDIAGILEEELDAKIDEHELAYIIVHLVRLETKDGDIRTK